MMTVEEVRIEFHLIEANPQSSDFALLFVYKKPCTEAY